MAAVNFELRHYQREAIRTLKTYLQKVAFMDVANSLYSPAPLISEEIPYVCIRIPTGGGKTIVAAHAVGVTAKDYLQVDNPMVLWLVPSNQASGKGVCHPCA